MPRNGHRTPTTSEVPPSRPRVVVYVTREHPQTGADELLVFDLLDEPEYVNVVPGGRVEAGETIEQTAIRELLEETGLEVRPRRELGVLEQPSWRVPGLRDENHFVEAAPVGDTLDGWDHGPFRCRWIPVVKGMSVYGDHGAFLDALLRKRVVAYVTRGRQLLVLEHEGVRQLPGGRVDPGENLEDGLRREVEEETGVSGLRFVRELAGPEEHARLFGAGAHRSHALHAVTDAETPLFWEHRVTGMGMDAGSVYPCRWVSLDDQVLLWGKPDPLVEALRLSIDEP